MLQYVTEGLCGSKIQNFTYTGYFCYCFSQRGSFIALKKPPFADTPYQLPFWRKWQKRNPILQRSAFMLYVCIYCQTLQSKVYLSIHDDTTAVSILSTGKRNVAKWRVVLTLQRLMCHCCYTPFCFAYLNLAWPLGVPSAT